MDKDLVPQKRGVPQGVEHEVGVEQYVDRDSWLGGRSTCIGGSDVAALFKDESGRSLNPWKSEYGLWAEKSGLATISIEESEAMEWGRRAEPMIADWYEEKTGQELINDGAYTIFRCKEHPHRGCTLDRRIKAFDDSGPGLLSIKNVSAWKKEDWDAGQMTVERMQSAIEEMADEWEPPLHYQIQSQYEMGILGYNWSVFAVLIGGQKAVHYRIERNDLFIEELFKRVDRFWQRVVERDPPLVDGNKSTTNVLKRLYKFEDDQKTVLLSEEAQKRTDELVAIDSQIKTLNFKKEELRNLIKDELKDAMVGELPNGGRWRWKTIKKGPQGPTEYRELRKLK